MNYMRSHVTSVAENKCNTFFIYKPYLILKDETPIVHYGRNTSLGLVAKGTTKTYNASDMCGPPASTVGFWDPGNIHDVLLTDLEPGQEYFYSYGSFEVS